MNQRLKEKNMAKRCRKAKFKLVSKKKYEELQNLEDYIAYCYKNKYFIKLRSEVE